MANPIVTVTCTLAASTARVGAYHANIPVKIIGRVAYKGGAESTTVGDTYLLCKIPHGATVIDWEIQANQVNGASEFNLGFTGGGLVTNAPTALAASVSSSVSFHRMLKPDPATQLWTGPAKLSISDAARDQFAFLTWTTGSAASSNSTSGSLIFMVEYTFQPHVA